MISINQYIDPNLVVPEIEGDSREQVISFLIEKIFQIYPSYKEKIRSNDLLKAFLEREGMQSTGIGNGIAFPHIRLEGWDKFVMVLSFSRKGIDFGSIDQKPVHFICLMISPAEKPYLILQTMAAMIRLFKASTVFKEYLNGRHSSNDVIRFFLQEDIHASKLITASELARPVSGMVLLSSSIEKATRIMHLKKLDSLPVLDDVGKFCGEINCLDIFQFGMPDFFNQLNSVSFVRHIDPFQKYFRIKKSLLVKDLYQKKVLPIEKEATLIEIVFEMTVKNRNRLFVVEGDGTLIGEIDRFSIIDKILLE